MAYKVNSGKDSRGDEHLFMEEFLKNQQAILQHKAQRGGDLEGAFEAVTGNPWPEGRSVKLNDGIPEMTKDRTVKSVLGKYVLPIAGAAAAPWLIPYLASLGGASGAVAGTTTGASGGTGGALASGIPLAMGETGLMATGAGVVAPLASTATVPMTGALAAGGTSSLVGTGMLGAAASGGSWIDKIMKAKDALGDAGDIGNSISNDEARLRRDRGNWAQEFDRTRLAGNRDDRDMEEHAMKNIQRGQYILGGGNPYTPPTLNSGKAGSFGLGAKPTTDIEKQAASTLQGQLLARLKPEGHFQQTPLESYANPGKLENIGRGINYGTGIANTAKDIWDIYKG